MSTAWDLYLVTDPQLGGGPDAVPGIVSRALEGGVSVVQLRDKHADEDTFRQRAAQLIDCVGARVPIFVNDRLDCAIELGLHLHIGQDDVPYEEARRRLPEHLMIGLSVSSEAELDDILARCDASGLPLPDVLGLGPVRATATKTDAAQPLGIDGIARLARRARAHGMACVAIGGIHPDNAAQLRAETDIDGLCIVSDIMTAEDPAAAARRLREEGARGLAERGSIPRVLSVAGTDPTGGAGAQADLKSIAAAGGFGYSVITAIVSQNTQGVRSIFTPPAEVLSSQLTAVSDDVAIDAVKIGMLGDTRTTEVLSEWLEEQRPPLVVLDPVMVATSGHRLLEPDAEAAVRRLAARVDIITPNIPELAVLCERESITSFEEAIEAAQAFSRETGTTVIVKGGHVAGPQADNAVVTPHGSPVRIPNPRVDSSSTHGTGCSLSSALAARAARGQDLVEALRWCTRWLHESIRHADALCIGHGHGPIDHTHRARRLSAAGSTVVPADKATAHLPFCDATSPDRLGPQAHALPREPRIPAAGPWTSALWRIGGDIWEEIITSDFIERLGEGTLAEEDFRFYIGQDAHYLAEYSHALSLVASRAEDPEESVAWAAGAQQCLVEEAQLHRSWLSAHPADAERGPSRTTTAYTDFLKSTAACEDYCIGAAAVLPCYWLYAEVGAALAEKDHDEHPYHSWLATYGDGSEFVEDVRGALQCVERAFAEATPRQRARALRAYLSACEHEYHFFEQALRRP